MPTNEGIACKMLAFDFCTIKNIAKLCVNLFIAKLGRMGSNLIKI